MSLAVQLRGRRIEHGSTCRTVITPAGPGFDSSALVNNLAEALRQIHESPVLTIHCGRKQSDRTIEAPLKNELLIDSNLNGGEERALELSFENRMPFRIWRCCASPIRSILFRQLLLPSLANFLPMPGIPSVTSCFRRVASRSILKRHFWPKSHTR